MAPHSSSNSCSDTAAELPQPSESSKYLCPQLLGIPLEALTGEDGILLWDLVHESDIFPQELSLKLVLDTSGDVPLHFANSIWRSPHEVFRLRMAQRRPSLESQRNVILASLAVLRCTGVALVTDANSTQVRCGLRQLSR